jgi:hypothetical protein
VLQRNSSRHDTTGVSFGLPGRAGVTILLFVPVWFGVFYGLFFLVAAAIWLVILPMALHQVWQPTRVDDDTAWPLITAERR